MRAWWYCILIAIAVYVIILYNTIIILYNTILYNNYIVLISGFINVMPVNLLYVMSQLSEKQQPGGMKEMVL